MERVLKCSKVKSGTARIYHFITETIMESAKPNIMAQYGQNFTSVVLNEREILEEHQINQLQDALKPIIVRNAKNKLILCFENVKYMSSAFLGVLVRVSKWVSQEGGSLELQNVDPSIRKVFAITQLDKVFTIV